MIYWTQEKLSFVEGLNKKHPSRKFNFKDSKTEIEFLHSKIYKDTDGNFFLTIYNKPTGQQKYLRFKSDHPPSLKKSIPYSQTLRDLNICTETNEITKHLVKLKEAFLKRGYQETTTGDHFNLNHQK